MADSYPVLIRRLAELAAGLQARRDEAQHWYADRCASAQAAVERAEAQLADLSQARAEAGLEVEEVDREAATIWAEFAHRLGPRADRFGGVPAPTSGPGAASPDQADRWLTAARELVERSVEAEPLPRTAHPALALFGTAGAAAAFGFAAAARWTGEHHGGDLAVGMPVIALVVTLLGPLFGLAPAKLLADRRHAVLDIRSVAVVLVAGLVTTATLVVLLR
ncbi:hypothetical protein [Micromonospora sp. LOL_023]|uniref:hypothetical protein n=1 Tax=Micromonospora sp. LOL_023 TaxID=3345418 RepID=UPI003A8C385B